MKALCEVQLPKTIKETLTPAWFQEAILGCYNLNNKEEWGGLSGALDGYGRLLQRAA